MTYRNSQQVTIKPNSQVTRVSVQTSSGEVLKALLPPLNQAHPTALRTFLESLSLFHQRQIHVVLYAVDEGWLCRQGLLDGLYFAIDSIFYTVEIHLEKKSRSRNRLRLRDASIRSQDGGGQ